MIEVGGSWIDGRALGEAEAREWAVFFLEVTGHSVEEGEADSQEVFDSYALPHINVLMGKQVEIFNRAATENEKVHSWAWAHVPFGEEVAELYEGGDGDEGEV